MVKKYHRAFGVYGIITIDNQLVVIKKNGGPYINRFDLPGGSLEDGESLCKAIVREIKEETGLNAVNFEQLGVTSFKYPWRYERFEFNQHICVFYKINKFDGDLVSQAAQFSGQDSLGAELLSLTDLTSKNSSPLVLKAKEYLQNGGIFKTNDQVFKTWKVLDQPVF
ncbi:NUDIX hydrolase [Xylocopilactobacillus apis]|uniref:Phosphohydrolase n=1 Tax=Xylocopilactobacillus apis TaxID=2932183 RepID=A0AAU9DEQ2_9LACO|nr:NUDIX hydrolase [Xylocopilactobacillus apis]BDR56671.1 phosphohydrolase [Xylocopilactobacillus apis]